jgi:hypothetical protein
MTAPKFTVLAAVVDTTEVYLSAVVDSGKF